MEFGIKCKICGERHPLGAPHIFKGTIEPVNVPLKGGPTKPIKFEARVVFVEPENIEFAEPQDPTTFTPSERLESAKAEVAAIEAGKAKRDRAAYMRDYRKAHPK